MKNGGWGKLETILIILFWAFVVFYAVWRVFNPSSPSYDDGGEFYDHLPH